MWGVVPCAHQCLVSTLSLGPLSALFVSSSSPLLYRSLPCLLLSSDFGLADRFEPTTKEEEEEEILTSGIRARNLLFFGALDGAGNRGKPRSEGTVEFLRTDYKNPTNKLLLFAILNMTILKIEINKFDAVLIQNKITPANCSPEEYPESWTGEVLTEKLGDAHSCLTLHLNDNVLREIDEKDNAFKI
ncbi:hypothetical protein M9H77_09022 [Catharanthus roseus]|uniref:Uncharacterized protein n=1 Tax=Catharanthus roseus TaxID=4058 RepID=A0ACC0BZR0_CATRO|nr:hypothetical protein M9H77_09022 [Catharanthus roseus]